MMGKSKGWKNYHCVITGSDAEKRAEGLAVSQAVLCGHCNKCLSLRRCESNVNFRPGPFAWCMVRKREILRSWRKNI